MSDVGTGYVPRGVDVAALLCIAGFDIADPGYWSLRRGAVELALEPQVLNAGTYKLQLYVDRMPQLDAEVLVDVRPRPGSTH